MAAKKFISSRFDLSRFHSLQFVSWNRFSSDRANDLIPAENETQGPMRAFQFQQLRVCLFHDVSVIMPPVICVQ